MVGEADVISLPLILLYIMSLMEIELPNEHRNVHSVYILHVCVHVQWRSKKLLDYLMSIGTRYFETHYPKYRKSINLLTNLSKGLGDTYL